MVVINGQPLYGMKIASPKPGCTSTNTSTTTNTAELCDKVNKRQTTGSQPLATRQGKKIIERTGAALNQPGLCSREIE